MVGVGVYLSCRQERSLEERNGFWTAFGGSEKIKEFDAGSGGRETGHFVPGCKLLGAWRDGAGDRQAGGHRGFV